MVDLFRATVSVPRRVSRSFVVETHKVRPVNLTANLCFHVFGVTVFVAPLCLSFQRPPGKDLTPSTPGLGNDLYDPCLS